MTAVTGSEISREFAPDAIDNADTAPQDTSKGVHAMTHPRVTLTAAGPRYTTRVRTVSIVSDTAAFKEAAAHVDNSECAAAVVIEWLSRFATDADVEHFGYIAADVHYRVIGIKIQSTGTAVQCPVDMASLWRGALALGARSVILFHTHPSGTVEPSSDDIGLTRRAAQAGSIIGIPVADHIIVAPQPGEGYTWRALRTMFPHIFETGGRT